jgi:hypothetical protein
VDKVISFQLPLTLPVLLAMLREHRCLEDTSCNLL